MRHRQRGRRGVAGQAPLAGGELGEVEAPAAELGRARRRRGSRSSAARPGPRRSRRWPGRARRRASGSARASRSAAGARSRSGWSESVTVLMAPTMRRAAPTALPSRSHGPRRRGSALGARRERRRRRLPRMDAIAPPSRRPRHDPVGLGPPRRRDLPRRRPHGRRPRPRPAGRVRLGHRRRARHRRSRRPGRPTGSARCAAGRRRRRWPCSASPSTTSSGCPTARLADHDDGGVDWVGRLLDEVRPDTILTFGADGMTFHPDHIAVHHWVTAGVARPRLPGPPAVRHADRRAPRPLRRPLRGVGHVHERRAPDRRAGRASSPLHVRLDRLRRSTARSPRCGRWRRRRAAPSPTSAWRCTPT